MPVEKAADHGTYNVSPVRALKTLLCFSGLALLAEVSTAPRLRLSHAPSCVDLCWKHFRPAAYRALDFCNAGPETSSTWPSAGKHVVSKMHVRGRWPVAPCGHTRGVEAEEVLPARGGVRAPYTEIYNTSARSRFAADVNI